MNNPFISKHAAYRWDQRTPPDSCSPEHAWQHSQRLRDLEKPLNADEVRYHTHTHALLLRRDWKVVTVLDAIATDEFQVYAESRDQQLVTDGGAPTDLCDFGLDPQESEVGDADETESADKSPNRSYRNGRCPAINMGDRKRCRAPVSRMNAADGFCGTHGREHNPWTIHDDSEDLVLITGRLDALSLDDLDQDEVDFDLDRVLEALDEVMDA